jgi:hypothetical protein
MKQFMRIMLARGHALMVEGRLDKSALAKYARDEQSALANDLASCFATTDIADAWSQMAAADLADVEMVSEAEFKGVLAARMQALAEETRRLCGYPEIDADLLEAEEQQYEGAEGEAAKPAIFSQSNMLDLFTWFERIEGPEKENGEQATLADVFNLKVVEFKPEGKRRGKSKDVEGQLGFAL